MRLKNSFLKISDRKWYKNAVIYDETLNWFINFDGGEHPEIVIHHTDAKYLTKGETVDTIRMVLEKIGIHARVRELKTYGNRLYPPIPNDGDRRMYKKSIAAYIKITKRLDVENLLISHEGIFNRLPNGQGKIHDFDYDNRK